MNYLAHFHLPGDDEGLRLRIIDPNREVAFNVGYVSRFATIA